MGHTEENKETAQMRYDLGGLHLTTADRSL